MKPVLLLALTLLLTACDTAPPRSRAMPTLDIPDTLKEQLAFTCVYQKDKLPELDPEADQLFLRARWMVQKNRLKEDPAVYPQVERLYRIAAAWGHYRANHNLAVLLMQGKSDAPDAQDLPVDLAKELIARGIPQGYYDMALLMNNGYGVMSDKKAALQYLRKAADLGNPQAQYSVGDKLSDLTIKNPVPYKIGLEMKRCAAEQGHAEAAQETGINLQGHEHYANALKYLQLAVKAGDETSAFALYDAFLAKPEGNTLCYLALEKDEERARRYEILSDILGRYSYLKPTVDEIDEIVPLPPAPLPPWDEQIKWVKDWEANIPPPLPDERRITAMAKEKGLDPKTGRPLPPKPQAAAPVQVPIGTQVASGQPCPRGGVWECEQETVIGERRLNIPRGEQMQEVMVPIKRTPWQILKGEPAVKAEKTVWTRVNV